MTRTKVVLGAVSVPLLSSCMMMGGLGHGVGSGPMSGPGHAAGSGYAGDPRWVEADDVETVPAHAPLQRTEASNGGLTIELSLPTPHMGGIVAIDALLRMESNQDELTGGDVWLRVRTPSGSVDSLRMQPAHSSRGQTYRTYYGFPLGGLYLVTVEGRTGVAGDSRAVSVTARVDGGSETHGKRQNRLVPAALLSGAGMAALMVLMMGSMH